MSERAIHSIFTRIKTDTILRFPADTLVSSLSIDKKSQNAEITLESAAEIKEEAMAALSSEIGELYGFGGVRVKAIKTEPRAAKPAAAAETETKKKKFQPPQSGYSKKARKKADIKDENLVFGRIYEDSPITMDCVSLESGKITVCGDIFYITTHEL
ncbi:MAG: hypothetical protein Q8878_08235, partial [Bacillota bacterium]|nr:hypothetical protein [Bacillota bacterium]